MRKTGGERLGALFEPFDTEDFAAQGVGRFGVPPAPDESAKRGEAVTHRAGSPVSRFRMICWTCGSDVMTRGLFPQ